MRLFCLIAALATPLHSFAAEGMWTMDNLPLQKIRAEYGFTPDADWIQHVMKSSLRIAGGCSASFISPNGLVMTNHHCASECVEQMSSASKDLIRDGFLAKNREEELRCPDLELNRLEQIVDVTKQVQAATANLTGIAYKQAQNAIKAKLTSNCVGKDASTVRCDVVDLYQGARFHLYKYHRFQDARLVWAPEKAAAFLGGDLDNFSFPRYNLDIILLRAYENGKPVTVQNFFPFNAKGAKEGELVFVAGHPKKTERQLTMAQLATVRDVTLPQYLIQQSEWRGTLSQFMKSSAEAQRIGHETLFYVENGIKARLGRLKTLQDPMVMRKKEADEIALRQFVASQPELKTKVGPAWDAIAQAEVIRQDIELPYQEFEKGHAFETVFFEMARTLVRGAMERSKSNAERLPEFADARLGEVEEKLFSSAPIYPQLEKLHFGFSLAKMREGLGADHALVKLVLGKQAPEQLANSLIDQSKLADIGLRKALWHGGMAAIEQSADPFIKLALAVDGPARQLRQRLEKEVESVVEKNTALISQARFARDGTSTYPDASFTLRLSYGAVKGWKAGEQTIPPFTFVNGAFARDTGAEPFALPPSWHQAKSKLNLALPMNFVTDNDIIGGNSGSPMINQKGEVVGLIFDTNIPALGGAYWFEPGKNRSVAVHSALILEALDKIYNAPHLVREISGRP